MRRTGGAARLDHDQVRRPAVCSQRGSPSCPSAAARRWSAGWCPPRPAFAGVVALDLVRMKRCSPLDQQSRLATLEPGLRGPEAEALLAEHGLTLGHFPQSFEYATIGGSAATRSSGQASAGYGRFDALVLGLEWPPRRARSSSAARRVAPPAPTSASSSSGPRARSG